MNNIPIVFVRMMKKEQIKRVSNPFCTFFNGQKICKFKYQTLLFGTKKAYTVSKVSDYFRAVYTI